MIDSLDALRAEMLARIERSGSEGEIEQIRVEALGRKGRLTLLLRGLKDLPLEERPRAGEQQAAQPRMRRQARPFLRTE